MKLYATVAAISTGMILMSACASGGIGASARKGECAKFSTKLFFMAGEEKLAPSANGSLRFINTRIAACTGVGGTLDVVTIEAFPDRTATGEGAETIANARANGVREAIIAVGIPEDRVKVTEFHNGRDDLGRLMRRRADISVTFR